MSDSAGFHVILRTKLGNVVSGSFTFNRGIGGEDHFSDFFLCQTLFQTIKADIIKQKLPENNGGFTAINFGKIDQKMYTELTTEHPIDLCRYQVANNYMGRVGLINSGGESHGASDLKDAVVTAVINKRAGGMGLISGRKAFQRPMKDGVELLHSIQDIYLDKDITIA